MREYALINRRHWTIIALLWSDKEMDDIIISYWPNAIPCPIEDVAPEMMKDYMGRL